MSRRDRGSTTLSNQRLPAFRVETRWPYATVFLVIAGGCWDGDIVLPVEEEDAGQPSDAGLRTFDDGTDSGVDAGSAERPDAGEDEADDAGSPEADAGPPDPDAGTRCEVEAPATPFVCEGDEDFCDELGDGPAPPADILAAWSRVESGDLILEMRFAAPPFSTGRAEHIGILLFEDEDPSNNDCSFALQVEGALVETEDGDRIFSLRNIGTGDYPPRHWATADTTSAVAVDLDLCADLAVSEDGHVLQLKLRGAFAYTDSRRYIVRVFHIAPPPVSEDIAPSGLNPVTSVGGAADGVAFISLCDAVCPAG